MLTYASVNTDAKGMERTVAFVDLAGFTAMTDIHGDEDAATLAERFAALTREVLDVDERLVKTIGDAVMLDAPDPAAGVQLVGRLCARTDAEDAFPVVRAGLHHGPVVVRGDDLYGATVNLASRVAAQAGGGQVLGTELVASSADVHARALGSFKLRNLPEPLELFEFDPCPIPHDRELDPVCRMAIDRSAAAGQLNFHGHEHWFCSLSCAGAFASDPDRYRYLANADAL